ncbi:MAG: hypothetical protein IJU92_04540 [Spirochaetaceae bacterium]|nr:hypothetical protein [Spirochaetaceae bacterium]
MCAKKRLLELPLKVVLTQEGSSFFIRKGTKLIRFKLAGDVEEYGIYLDKFQPATIQRLLLAGYVSKLEISKPEFVSSRQEIMDLSKLIVYSVLYRQYDSFIFNELINSPVIKKWNRMNPANIIDDKTNINEKLLAKFLERSESSINETKRRIMEPLTTFILKNGQLAPEEKNVQIFLSEKFLNNLRPFTWFILPKIQESHDSETILKTLRTGLVEYMDKTKIAEYISLMLMELIISAENLNLRNEAKKLFPELTNPQDALLDPTIRRRLVAELERKQELVFLSWKIGGTSSASIGTSGKLQITIYSKNEKSETVRENLNDVKNSNVGENSLIDFYKDLPEGSQDSSLGMYYISYLSDACQQVNVRFESSASRFQNSDLAVINMSFMF